MVIVLSFIFILCIFIRIYLWYSAPQISWSQFDFASPAAAEEDSKKTTCVDDGDCPLSNHKCFDSECIRAESETCDSHTGMWVKDSLRNSMKCVCRDNSLITQSIPDGNCAVPVACGIFGSLSQLIPDPHYCECDKGFTLDPNTDLCVHVTEKDVSASGPCPPNTVSSQSPEALQKFDAEYLKQFGQKNKCLSLPCRTNVLNGKSIEHGHLEDERCVCNPAHGNYAVHLEVKHYLKKGGNFPNACANIYEDEIKEPRYNFALFCYFYLRKRGNVLSPVCFTSFFGLPPDNLVPQFRGKTDVSVSGTWPHTYDQYILKKEPSIRQDIKKWHRAYSFPSYTQPYLEKVVERRVTIPDCSNTPSNDSVSEKLYIMNNIFRENLFCRYTGSSEPLYKDTVIVNPRVVEIENDREHFSNGYQMYYDAWSKWKISPAFVGQFKLPVENLVKKIL